MLLKFNQMDAKDIVYGLILVGSLIFIAFTSTIVYFEMEGNEIIHKHTEMKKKVILTTDSRKHFSLEPNDTGLSVEYTDTLSHFKIRLTKEEAINIFEEIIKYVKEDIHGI
tara:strand:+ start:15715 stop:16047 length:333 start_codon:yes stop_codon:yes gene_type:complete